ncbi:PLAC8 family-domain-containing protein [Exophiala viscosa]|uniref:PLAC8 family-domain-containing protein n=1 Tax=Exophiala viscosa TaxID=2486360 RepID=A0AAN6IG08_9EURO|nr:PLAC8 family-domain-containing protein [Exophiala viscosa]
MEQQQYKQEPFVAEKPAMGSPAPGGPNAVFNGQPQASAYPQGHIAPGAPGRWTFGLFDCCSPVDTCCLGCWCPCILYGKTYAREHGDPDASGVNTSCMAWYAASCFGAACILQFMNRGQIREKYGIEGGSFGDFCASWCCGCCTLIQEDKESIVRLTGTDPKTKERYISPGQMSYP